MKKSKKKDNVLKHFILFRGKKASSYWFLYILAFTFVLAILWIIFNQILQVYIYPTTILLSNGDTSQPDRWLTFWNFMPWIIVLLILIFSFIKFTQPETTEYG